MATIEKRVSVDLTSCEREPIHILGGIQPFGYLIAYTPDGLIARISANAADLFGRPAEEMIGMPVADHIGEALYDTLRTRAGRLTGDDSVERLFGQQLGGHKALVDIAMHWSTGLVVIELEPHARGATTDHATDVKRMVAQLSDAGDLDVLMDRAARQMKALTGFDRVMIYRLSDGGEGHGEVVAEAAEDGLEPFLGLNYPASDIPAQARRLYLRSQLRIIADIDAAAVSILPEQGADGARLDLSLSSLRSVSPIHIEYLRNMGVRASMSVSIIRDGKLWGLFACHHYSGPRILTYDVRTAAELFGQLFALILAEKESAAMRALDDQARVLHDRLMSQLAGGARLDENFEAVAETLRSIIPCDGVSAHIDGGHQSVGIAPDRAASEGLTTFLNTAAASRVYASDHLAGVYEGAAALPIAGILAIPVSRNPRDYIVCYRKAVPQTVTWAGNPEKAVETGPNGDRLMPRSSFAAWTEEMRDRSQPWTDQEVRAAEWLRVTLLEVVLKMTDKAATEAVKAAERQELLIAELNHRVRNILTLIRGVIVQSRGDTDDVAGFTEKIGGRIHALARAHDQITQVHWAPASLQTLLKTEGEAYLSDKADRLRIGGDDVLLKPSAFSTMSLVVHELLTNSCKYGALSDSTGHIDVKLARNGDGDLLVDWRDVGGPKVKPPARKGFGTTIIERSIPFELDGDATIEFPPTGVEAAFRIPASFVVDGEVEASAPVSRKDRNAAAFSGNVLILEDNMIIAMDVEDIVTKHGAQTVDIASRVAEALTLIEEKDFTFAMLDVNLGSETSEAVADELVTRGVPFAFATGYGDAHEIADRFPNAAVLQKPIDEAALMQAIAGS